MKIKLGTLRKIIKEEVSKMLVETVTVDQLKSKPVCSSWLKQVTKSGAAEDHAAAWDDMVAAVTAGVQSVRGTSDQIAGAYGLDPLMVSFHLRQLIKDPDVASGACPSGADFLAAAESLASAAMAASKPAPAPAKEFDPYERSPQLVGSSGRYVGD